MVTHPPPNPKASMWAWMAYTLRFQRSQRGLSGEALGKIINCSKATVSRLESGHTKIDAIQAAALDRAWETGGLFSTMLWYARLGHDPDWLQQYVELEAQASMIRIWQVDLVPGLLQTAEYANAGLTAGGVKDVEAAAEGRMARQKVLCRERPPHLFILLFEGLLEIPVGGPEVMRAQLSRLVDASETPNISIRVVPKAAGAHPGLDGAFMVLSSEMADVAYIEAPGGGRLVSSASEVRSYLLRYERIGQNALPADASRDLIRRALEAMR